MRYSIVVSPSRWLPLAVCVSGCSLFHSLDDLSSGSSAGGSSTTSSSTGGGAGQGGEGGSSGGGGLPPPPATRPVFFMEGVKVSEDTTEGRPTVAFPFCDEAPRTIGCATDPSMVSYINTALGGTNPPAALVLTATYYDPMGREGLSKLAFTSFNPSYLATDTNPFFIATELTDCDTNPPVRVDQHEGVPAWRVALLPRFSLDGSRIAYLEYEVDSTQSQAFYTRRIVTVDAAGVGAANEVRRGIMAGSDVNIPRVPPTWYLNQGTPSLAWVEQLSESVTIRSAPDANLPQTEALVSCPDDLFWFISQVAVLGSGGIVAIVGELFEADEARTIYLLPQGADCSAERPPQRLHASDPPEASSYDLALSPDGTRLAHISNRPGSPAPARVWISPVAGGDPVQCHDGSDGSYDLGPQWVNDTRLLWTRLPTSGSSGLVGDVMIATVDSGGACTDVAPLLTPEGVPGQLSRVLPHNDRACSVSTPGAPAPLGWLSIAALLAAGLTPLRRVRRTSRLARHPGTHP